MFQKQYNNPFLDKDFLDELIKHRNRTVYAKVVALNYAEEPMEYIIGRITSGSINLDGNSAVRRTCNFSMVANEMNIKDYIWGLKTKVQIYIGIENTINKNYDSIIWFNQGMFILSSFSTSENLNSWTINIQGKDKMCMLNGELGGTIQSLTQDFGKYKERTEDGTLIEKDMLIKDIIFEAVQRFTGDLSHKIIINNVEDVGLELLEYHGKSDLYMQVNYETGEATNYTLDGTQEVAILSSGGGWLSSNITLQDVPIYFNSKNDRISTGDDSIPTFCKPAGLDTDVIYNIARYKYGETCGYRLTGLTYAGDLIANAGETITSVLDKIVSMLGDFEYFYDVNGNFIFQEKQSWINVAQNSVDEDGDGVSYVNPASYASSTIYSFNNGELITSYSNTPDFANLRNDFSIQGEKTGATGAAIPIHVRYALDKKPDYYKDFDGNIQTIPEKAEMLYNEISEKVSKEYLTKVNGYQIKNNANVQGLQTPTKNNDGSWSPGWQDIRDQYEYYTICIKGETKKPNKTMKQYSYNNSKGCISVKELASQLKNNSLIRNNPSNTNLFDSTNANDVWLIEINRKTGYVILSHGSGKYNDNTFSSYKNTQYESFIDKNGTLVTQKVEPLVQEYFHYPYASCSDTHTFLSFLKNDIEKNGYDVFFYNPNFYFADSWETMIQDEINGQIEELRKKINIVDQREIIYRMALDWYKHNNEDDFLIQVAENNAPLYFYGYTSYEKYYLDLEAFQRQLYNYDLKPLDNPNGQEIYYQQIPSTSLINKNFIIDYSVINSTTDLIGGDIDKRGYFIPIKAEKCTIELVPEKNTNYYICVNEKYLLCENLKSFKKGVKYFTYNTEIKEYEPILTFIFKPGYKNALYKTDEFNPETYQNMKVEENPEDLLFWFDFLDTEGKMSQYSVYNIGDRPKAINDTKIKAIYYKETPTVLFCNPDDFSNSPREKTGYTYVKLPKSFESMFVVSGKGKTAMKQLETFLQKNTYCTESITISTIPIYHLEPNTRIYVYDEDNKINGEYLITKITIPLQYNGTMSINAVKIADSIYGG